MARRAECASLIALFGLALAIAACSAPRKAPKLGADAPLRAPQSGAPQATARGAAASAKPMDPKPMDPEVPLLFLEDPELLASIAEGAGNLGSLVFGAHARSTAELAELPTYRQLIAVLERDLTDDRTQDPLAGVGLKHAHRQFDARWLRSPNAHFELVGAVPRVDRKPFEPARCGELRLVYRLAYDAESTGRGPKSRLPMTLNVVHWLPRDSSGCQHIAQSLAARALDGSHQAEVFLKALSGLALKSVEVNLQSVRWPATVRPSMAGHAEYILRVFRQNASGELVPGPLENTPDTARLAHDTELKRELIGWLSRPESLAAADLGTLRMPEKYLATKARSVTPHGLGRLANRPSSQVLSPRDFAEAKLEGYVSIGSPEALLRRLDGLSCPGCHQSRSVAGFHLLGRDRPEQEVDALFLGVSPHLTSELRRRREYLESLMTRQTPDEFRAPAEFANGAPGSPCSLGTPGFESWTCQPGQHCMATSDPLLGHCYDPEPGVGQACELGSLSQVKNPRRDVVSLEPRLACGSARVCERNAVGFPGGMCAGTCDALGPDAVCGGIALLNEFNACLAAGTPFGACVKQHTRPGALQRCDETRSCRDDYVCARIAPNLGGCLPPYFLFQLRVDGHSL